MSLKTVLATSAFLAAQLVSSHSVITNAVGNAGGSGMALGVNPSTPRDGTRRNPFQQDATRFRGQSAQSVGETVGAGASNIESGTSKIMAETGDSLPQVTPGGELTMTLHQVNADGAGPYTCMINGDGTAQSWQNIQVTQNVPGNQRGRNNGGSKSDIPLKVAIPPNQQCTGNVAGQAGVCMVRCQNPARAGPFGGVVPVQMVQAAGVGAGAGTGNIGTGNVGVGNAGTGNAGAGGSLNTGGSPGTGNAGTVVILLLVALLAVLPAMLLAMGAQLVLMEPTLVVLALATLLAPVLAALLEPVVLEPVVLVLVVLVPVALLVLVLAVVLVLLALVILLLLVALLALSAVPPAVLLEMVALLVPGLELGLVPAPILVVLLVPALALSVPVPVPLAPILSPLLARVVVLAPVARLVPVQEVPAPPASQRPTASTSAPPEQPSSSASTRRAALSSLRHEFPARQGPNSTLSLSLSLFFSVPPPDTLRIWLASV